MNVERERKKCHRGLYILDTKGLMLFRPPNRGQVLDDRGHTGVLTVAGSMARICPKGEAIGSE